MELMIFKMWKNSVDLISNFEVLTDNDCAAQPSFSFLSTDDRENNKSKRRHCKVSCGVLTS